MFEIFKYRQGKIILGAIVFVCFAIYQSYKANKLINRVNEENSSDYKKPKYETAPIYLLVLVLIILVGALIFPMSSGE